jgi:hypothetical protein
VTHWHWVNSSQLLCEPYRLPLPEAPVPVAANARAVAELLSEETARLVLGGNARAVYAGLSSPAEGE